jgi:hypothetical protein
MDDLATKEICVSKPTSDELWPAGAAQIDFFYEEMRDKIFRMSEDGNETHISEWIKILPECEIIDKWYKEAHPEHTDPGLLKAARKEAGLPC